MNQMDFQRNVIREEYIQREPLNKKRSTDKVSEFLPRYKATRKNRFRESVKLIIVGDWLV